MYSTLALLNPMLYYSYAKSWHSNFSLLIKKVVVNYELKVRFELAFSEI